MPSVMGRYCRMRELREGIVGDQPTRGEGGDR